MADKTASTSKTASAKELLSSLTKKKPLPKKPDSRSSRPELALPQELEATFTRFIGAHAVAEVVDARREQEKAALDEGCFDLWVEKLWKSKARPANPSVKLDKNGSPDLAAIFQVHERYQTAFEIPEDKSPADEAIALFRSVFASIGMNAADAEADAKALVENEIDFTPKTSVEFNKLVNGHYEGDGKNRTFVEATPEEQALATKAILLLHARTKADLSRCEPLTDEEEAAIIDTKYNVVIRPSFLQRVCNYSRSLDQLKKIFSVIKPVKYPSHIKFAFSDTPEEKNKRLQGEFANILGVK